MSFFGKYVIMFGLPDVNLKDLQADGNSSMFFRTSSAGTRPGRRRIKRAESAGEGGKEDEIRTRRTRLGQGGPD